MLAKLSGGRGAGRCASLQSGGFEARRRGRRGACARQRAEGGGPVGRSTRSRSERLQKQTSRKRKLEKHPNLFLPWEVPSVSARSWEWSVQVECWLDCAGDVPPSPPLPGRFFTLHLEGVGVGDVGGSIGPSLFFPTYCGVLG